MEQGTASLWPDNLAAGFCGAVGLGKKVDMSPHTEERNSDFQGVGHPHRRTVCLEEGLGNTGGALEGYC